MIDEILTIGNIDYSNYGLSPEYIPGIWVIEILFYFIIAFVVLTIIHKLWK